MSNHHNPAVEKMALHGLALLVVAFGLSGCSHNRPSVIASDKNHEFLVIQEADALQLIFPGIPVGSTLNGKTVTLEIHDLQAMKLLTTIRGTYRKSSEYSFTIKTSVRPQFDSTSVFGISLISKFPGEGPKCSGCAHNNKLDKLKGGLCGCNILEFFPNASFDPIK